MTAELYGCPGCGKTYVVRQIIGHDETVAMSTNYIKSSIINFAKIISTWTPESRFLKRKLHKVISGQNTTPIFITRNVNSCLNNITILCFGYKHLKTKIIMAEGLVHRVVSMAVNFGWDERIVFEILHCFDSVLKDVQPFYLEVDLSICFVSIKNRNRHETEMDELSDEELRLYLKKFKDLFDSVTTHYGYKKITRNDYKELEEYIK